MQRTADVVICGAGIAGAAAAYHLACRERVRRVVIVDDREPLTLTSDKGTQGYRNWWPGPDDTMLKLVSRSIDLMEETARETGNIFRMNRRGYVFATADETRLGELRATAGQVSSYGMGDVREHGNAGSYRGPRAEGFADQPDGADILTGDAVRAAFPFLAPETVGAVHVRRAGTMNSVSLGAWFLKQAAASGAEFVRGEVAGFDTTGGAMRGVRLSSGEAIAAEKVVIAAGPRLHEIAALLDLELPVYHELHSKLCIRDTQRAVPRDAPFVIWSDPMTLEGRELPGGVHMRPVDLTAGDELYLIWTYETDERPYVWPPKFDPEYAETVVRGCARMIPAMAPYIESASRGVLDGGYYCKTPENRPLIGPLAVPGVFVLGALSGIGLMSAHATAELVGKHVMERRLPDYARWFLPSRYEDPRYCALVEAWGPLVGQL